MDINTEAILQLAIMINYLILQKRTCCHKLYAKKKKNENFEKMHFATYLQYPK